MDVLYGQQYNRGTVPVLNARPGGKYISVSDVRLTFPPYPLYIPGVPGVGLYGCGATVCFIQVVHIVFYNRCVFSTTADVWNNRMRSLMRYLGR